MTNKPGLGRIFMQVHLVSLVDLNGVSAKTKIDGWVILFLPKEERKN